ncbi:hypothetical protein VNO77_35087 [Canavalia gladiata]|uniref:Uncharacterized protein n=1 Tax=Canavalia gladiata TaxID=3824 RepID=A0AAN9KGW7_CANGL
MPTTDSWNRVSILWRISNLFATALVHENSSPQHIDDHSTCPYKRFSIMSLGISHKSVLECLRCEPLLPLSDPPPTLMERASFFSMLLLESPKR